MSDINIDPRTPEWLMWHVEFSRLYSVLIARSDAAASLRTALRNVKHAHPGAVAHVQCALDLVVQSQDEAHDAIVRHRAIEPEKLIL